MNRYEFIDSIIQKYESWSGDNMESVCKNCAKELQRAGFGRSDVQEYFAKDGIYNEETGEGTWDKDFVDCIVNELPINSSRKITSSYQTAINELEEYFERSGSGNDDEYTIHTRVLSRDDENHIAKICEDNDCDFAIGTSHVTIYPIESSRRITSARNIESVNDAGNSITDVWVTEVEGGSYVRNSRQIKSSKYRWAPRHIHKEDVEIYFNLLNNLRAVSPTNATYELPVDYYGYLAKFCEAFNLDSEGKDLNKWYLKTTPSAIGADDYFEVDTDTIDSITFAMEDYLTDGIVNGIPVESSRRITSARNIESADEDMARDLELFIETTGELYRYWTVPIIKNLEKKVQKGVFDFDKSLIMWQRLADEGAKRYMKEIGGPGFSVATRKEVAKQLADHYEENYMGDNPITSAKENKAEESGPHMQFKKLDEDKKAELREQIEDELEAQLNKLHVKFDVDTWDNTVEYILSFFEEDNFYNPKDAKQAVHEWYLDTKDEFPEMFEQDVEKKKIASALYNSRIQGKLIGSARKPIKSAKSFTKGDNWKHNTAVLPSSKSMLKSFFEDGSWSWDDTVALVGHIDGGRPYVIFGAAGKYPHLEKGRGLFHDQTLNDIGWFTFERYCNDNSVFNIPQARYAVLK